MYGLKREEIFGDIIAATAAIQTLLWPVLLGKNYEDMLRF